MNHEGMSVISVFPAKSTVEFTSWQLFFLESQEFEKKISKSSLSKRTEKERSHFRVDCQKPANRNHAKIRNHRRTIARDVTDRTLFIPLYL